MIQISQLKQKWEEKVPHAQQANEHDIQSFQQKYNVILPNDLKEYFLQLNGTAGEYTSNIFEFSTLDTFCPIKEKLSDWQEPHIKELVRNEDLNGLFVLASWHFNLQVYAIRLHPESGDNVVYELCGTDHKIVSNSFTQFIEFYVSELEISA